MRRSNSWVDGARRCVGTWIWWLLFLVPAGGAQGGDSAPIAERVLTNIAQIWSVPREDRAKPHRIQTEVVIYYFDAEWSTAQGECQGQPTWLPIWNSPIPLKPGQRVGIDGFIIPLDTRFLWDKTQIRILDQAVPLRIEAVADLGKDPRILAAHLVSAEGLIDSQIADPTHYKLNILSGKTRAIANVIKGPDRSPPHFKDGDYARIKCVYTPQFDRNGNMTDLSLWVAGPGDIEVIGSLRRDPRFKSPVIQSENIRDKHASELVHVQGMVRHQELGDGVTIWDDTGQVLVESKQSQPLRCGDRIEAIGYPESFGVQQCLHSGLYRLIDSSEGTDTTPVPLPGQSPLRLAEWIRNLSPQEANRHLPVSLRAVVTWSHPEVPFAYVQDASGGIRIMNPKWDEKDTSKPGTIVVLEGVTAAGEFVPVVTNGVLRRVGWWDQEPGRLVSLEQALTGLEDGRWVEMRGFVRQVTRTNGLVRFDLSTSSGEFQAWAHPADTFEALKGAIIRVQGVCAALSNARHQLTGIQIWAPDLRYIRVEEAALDEVFAVPSRTLADLRRFSPGNRLNQRVRTSGTVVLQARGRYLYLQDGEDSLFALSQQRDALQPGDRVEVVGFPGNEGRRFLLREAVFRRLSAGAEPRPEPLSALHAVNVDLEGRLVRAEGSLLNISEKDGEIRLLVQTANSAFEANLDATTVGDGRQGRALALGSQLAVTGVYEVRSDEYGKPRSFFMHLRSWTDVDLLRPPSWWTPAHSSWVLLGVLAVFLMALGWALLISRKNRLLRQAQADLQTAHDKLELRVAERTRELRWKTAFLEAQVTSSIEGILVVDNQGKKLIQNQRVIDLWKIPPHIVEDDDDAKQVQFVMGRTKNPEQFAQQVRCIYAQPDEITHDEVALTDGTFLDRHSHPVVGQDGTRYGRIWIFHDITERKQAEAALARAHRQLVETSRQVGRAEVATSVLHNVGNVLNSVNVSATLVHDRLQRSSVTNLAKAAAMIEEHRDDLPLFLTQDPKGKRLPGYLKALTLNLTRDHEDMRAEVESLRKSIEHINVIVAMQQGYARQGGALEDLDPKDIMEDAIQINSAAYERDQIQLIREYQAGLRVRVDRHKALQILVNLLSNARYALERTAREERQVVLSVCPGSGARVCLRVRDNGAGIEPDHLNRIFSQGFTTRKNGHGFGLHSGANAAKEMNGSLSVASDGPGQGAVFTLELPAI